MLNLGTTDTFERIVPRPNLWQEMMKSGPPGPPENTPPAPRRRRPRRPKLEDLSPIERPWYKGEEPKRKTPEAKPEPESPDSLQS